MARRGSSCSARLIVEAQTSLGAFRGWLVASCVGVLVLGAITLRARETFLPFAPQRAPAVTLEVEDTGPGISPEVQERLFDPFFTIKEAGTGLALAVAERIVHRHGGALQFRTQMQRGTIIHPSQLREVVNP
jgi:signal transduction histidine kinase